MNEELLDKYFAGKCTPEESALVRSWLSKPVPQEDRLLKQSWQHIQKYMHADAIRPLHPRTRYFAAAMLGLLTVAGIAWKLVSEELVIRNTSQSYKAFDTKGLQLRLPPSASARVNIGLASHRADLMFCGDVRIYNTSENDVDMKLNLSCTNPGSPEHSTVVKVRKDKKYLAFRYRFKTDEVVVVEEDRLFDLPLPLQKKALEALEI